MGEMSERQVGLVRHALGLPNPYKRSYRNYFVCGPGNPDFDDWTALVDAGLAKTRKGNPITGGDPVFWAMLHAAEAVLKRGERLDMEDFPESLRASPDRPVEREDAP